MNNLEKYKKSFNEKNLDIDPPLFSIITVTRNLIIQGREDSFRKAIYCVQNQSFKNIEHIVMDGASDDGTQNMIEAIITQNKKNHKAVPIRYKSESDSGLYDAMNKAVNFSKGHYVLFLNSDDSLAGSDILEKIANLIKPSFPDFVYGSHIVKEANGKERLFSYTNLAAFLQRMPFCHNSMVVQKTIFQKLGGHDLKYRVSADYEFVFKMLTNGHIGLSADFPISVFKTGGVSSDVNSVANDHALFWKKFFAVSNKRYNWSHSDFVKWYQIGQIPLIACWFTFKKGRTIPLLRKAAIHSAMITLRRRLQPWRTWDNLKK